jgi:hypothetical protein
MIKLIACDLDGTLLLNGATKPDPELFPLIDELIKRDILFVAASGRQYACMQRLFAPVRDRIAYICENGALCFYRGELISETHIERSLGKQILRTIRETKGCEILLSGKNTSYLETKNMDFVSHMKHVVGNNVMLVPDTTKVTEPFYKISTCNFGGVKDERKYFQKIFGDAVNVVTSGNIWLDLMVPGTSKATGLSALVDHLGIDPSECAAFGDNFNDVEMLQFVGESYAMDNAHPDIRKLAKYHTARVEDTLKEVLSK